jgi:hypothetical protein
LGYVVNRLDSTSFQDVDELLNLFIIQRLVSASIRDIIKSSGRAGANNDPVKRYFSRDNLKVDGEDEISNRDSKKKQDKRCELWLQFENGVRLNVEM